MLISWFGSRRPFRLVPLLMPLLLLAAPGRSRAELPSLRSEGAPVFTANLSVLRDGEGRPALVVNVSVPYTELQWDRGPRGFMAAVEVGVALDPARGARGYGRSRPRYLLVQSYAETRSPNSVLQQSDTLAPPPGRYQLRVRLSDLQADRTSDAGESINLDDWSKVPVGLSDLELGTVDSLKAFSPNVENRYGKDVARLAGRASLFDRRSGAWPRSYTVNLRIRDDTGEVLVGDSQTISAGASGEAILVVPSRSDLFIGGYTMEVELVEGRDRWKVSRGFEVEESGPPQGADFERMLEPLSYIAPDSEIDAMRKLPPDQRAAGWEAFWRRRDPTPDTPRNEALIDFVRRVRYADQHFQGFGAGWRSDMGRAYITYGPPDQIESRAATVQTPPIEIWYYQQPYRRLVFVDREGFGRYVWVPSGME